MHITKSKPKHNLCFPFGQAFNFRICRLESRTSSFGLTLFFWIIYLTKFNQINYQMQNDYLKNKYLHHISKSFKAFHSVGIKFLIYENKTVC